MSHHFWGSTMWSVLLGAIPFDIKLSILCRFTISVCMHPPHHTMFPLPNCAELNWGKCFWKVSFEAFKSIITMLMQISFHSRRTQWSSTHSEIWGEKCTNVQHLQWLPEHWISVQESLAASQGLFWHSNQWSTVLASDIPTKDLSSKVHVPEAQVLLLLASLELLDDLQEES